MHLNLPMMSSGDNNVFFYYHGETADGYRFTIAGNYTSSNDDNEIDTIAMGISLCSKKDQFIKKTGRQKAKGRILSLDLHGKFYSSLEHPSRTGLWFKGNEGRVFVTAAKLNQSLTREGIINKFNLK